MPDVPKAVFPRRLILIGSLAAGFGIILYFQLGRIADLRPNLSSLNAAAALSISMTWLGLLATLVGGVAWSRRAPLVHSLLAAGVAGIVAFTLTVFVDINVHGPTAILMPVVFAGVIGCLLIFFITAIRFGQRDKANQ